MSRTTGWVALSLLALLIGLLGYAEQWRLGLAVTGLQDAVVWGLYISQVVFWVGVAASAVILVVPVYGFRQPAAAALLPLAEAVALVAVLMSLLFVTVDLGQPLRVWHALPLLGRLHFPQSIMAWDLVVLVGYLLLTLLLWAGWRHPIGLLLAILLGISIHTVTAFLLAGHPARPFWFTGLMAPRFIASAFAAGAGLLLLLRRHWPADTEAWGQIYLRRLFLGCLGLDFFLLGSEGFVWFYRAAAEGETARLLYGGGLDIWSAWAWTGLALKGMALLLVWRFAKGYGWGVLGIWMDKGLGLVVPGFIPTPLGEVVRYWPTRVEWQVSLGIWALGALLLILLLRRNASDTPHAPP
ncbi:MAG: polysulfide reductase NrfD [Magnetococcales bacterium]|nr:polysulfide reductase NrfD [Magnetococcales bacterium]